MQKRFPIGVLALLIATIVVVNGVAEHWHLYFFIWWLDIPMHLAGGLWIGLTVLTYHFSFQRQFKKNLPVRILFALTLLVAFGIGVGWEIFEYFVNRSHGLPFDPIDTLSDICNGIVGAGLGTAIFTWKGYNKFK